MKMSRRVWLILPGVALLCSWIAWWLSPSPVIVETGPIVTGPMQVITEDQGETRLRDRYIVAAPISGRLERVLLREGDSVAKGQSVAMLAPLPLSTREREELQARAAAAAATERSARAELRHVMEDLQQARRETDRLATLLASDATSRQDFEQARNQSRTLELDVEAARHRAQAAAADLEAARSGLVALTAAQARVSVAIRSPESGLVLRVMEQSERVITAGAPIMLIGDPVHLEVVLEMLSSEAVKVTPGMEATLVGWGGDQPLKARVRLIEPYAYTKMSALGVEEKRTHVILDFVDPPGPLGDGYRVSGRIVLWSAGSVLQAPLSTLFRCGGEWCVFVVQQSHARLRKVSVGHRSTEAAEITAGLSAGEEAVRHPPNELEDGARVQSSR